MNHCDMEIVSAVRSVLASLVGTEQYELWFGSSCHWQYAGDQLQITVPSRFQFERLRKNHLAQIEAAAQSVLGHPAKVQLLVAPQAADAASDGHTAVPVATKADAVSGDPTDSGRQAELHASRPCPVPDDPPHATASRRRFAKLSDFCVGTCNRLGFAGAERVIQQPGKWTPLVLFGPAGSGKTHLLEAIWCELRRRYPRMRAVYLSAPQFTSYFLQALNGGGLPSFRRKYREVNVLLLDDVQFLIGKQATTVELVQTIDVLLRDGRQLVLSADRPPRELKPLGGEVITRLASGLTCELQPLDCQTRREVLARIAQREGVPLSDPLIDHAASLAPGDCRYLSGIVHQLSMVSQALGRTIDRNLIDQVVADLFPAATRFIRLTDIQRAICHEFDLAPERLQSSVRNREVTQPRMLAMWLARKFTRAPLSEIGEYFGRRSHTTVLSAEQRVNEWLDQDAQLKHGHRTMSVRDVIGSLEHRLRTG